VKAGQFQDVRSTMMARAWPAFAQEPGRDSQRPRPDSFTNALSVLG